MGPTQRRAHQKHSRRNARLRREGSSAATPRSSSTIRLLERIICGKHTARTRATQHTQQEPFVAITPKTLQHSHLPRGGGVCGIYTNIVVTQRCFCPRKPIVSKQPTCVESKREVNENCEGSALWRSTPLTPHHTPPFYRPRDELHGLRTPEALRTPLGSSGGWDEVAQSVSSASTRSINCRSATSVRLATPSSSKILMSFVTSVTMSRASRRASWTDRSAVRRRTSARAY